MRKIVLGVVIAAASSLYLCAEAAEDNPFSSAFPRGMERVWAGPEYYANRLLDWRVADGRLECLEGSKAKPMRTVHLLTRRLKETPGALAMRVRTGPIDPGGNAHEETWTGFLLGAGGDHVDYRTSALCHHWPGEDGGIIAAVDGAGRAVIRDNSQTRGPRGPSGDFPLSAWPLIVAGDRKEAAAPSTDIDLVLTAEPRNGAYIVTLAAHDHATGLPLSTVKAKDIAPEHLSGNVALVSHSSRKKQGPGYWFREWRVEGSKVEAVEDHAFGPVLTAQHTLSAGALKMTAQMGPLGRDDTREALLQVQRGGAWETVAEGTFLEHSCTIPFRVEPWTAEADTPYRIAYALRTGHDNTQTYYYTGVIQKPPDDRNEFVVAAFTGHNISAQGQPQYKGRWNGNDFWFPHNDIVDAVGKHTPDFLFFSGDQVYERGLAGIIRSPADKAVLDYLYHWYRWCWAFRDLARDIPTVCIPDDHDVYHGNLWGAGGRKAVKREGMRAQDSGGYVMEPVFVNAVHATQTSHLPDPVDPAPIEQGITVYHTNIEYAGMSFAVLADRMWKSSATVMVPEGNVVNGWFLNIDFDTRNESDVPGAHLLGERQLAFLEHWANDWRNGCVMKVVLSQTIFANVATLPKDAVNDSVVPKMRQPSKPGEYMEGDEPAADADSNGWPQTGRNKALRAMRKGFAFHIAGDQHLGSFIQYGVEDWNDAPYALCVPAIANLWPRRWFPPEPGANRKPGTPKYTGEFLDGFGNKMTVHAVCNPEPSLHEPVALYDRAPGYGIVRLNRATRAITAEAWPRWVDPAAPGAKPYRGWPHTFSQFENYGRKAKAYLPELKISGAGNPVVQVVDEAAGEIVYTVRIVGTRFRPKVFAEGLYTVRVGDPDNPPLRVLAGLHATAQNTESLSVSL